MGHILRASAHAACAAELTAGMPAVGVQCIEDSLTRATPTLIEVLSRFPSAPAGKSRLARLMSLLDTELRRR